MCPCVCVRYVLKQGLCVRSGSIMVPGFGLVKRGWNWLHYCYFQFALHTCITMLEPAEEKIINCCLLLFLAMFSYVTITYLPGHLIMMLNFTRYVFGM